MDHLAKDEKWQHDARKCIEELNELAVVLIQQYNKPWTKKHGDIQDELADVQYRISNLIDRYYSEAAVLRRIQEKWGGKK